MVFFLMVFLSSKSEAFSQVSISGPNCVVAGSTYIYNYNGSYNGSTTMTWCVSNGTILQAYGSNITSSGGCSTGNAVGSIAVKWTNPGNGSVTLSSSNGNASPLSVTIVNVLAPGSITANKTQTIGYNTVPGAINCSVAMYGACSPSYSYQWQQSADNLSWNSIAGQPSSSQTSQNFIFTSPLLTTTYYRRVVTETSTSTTLYSDVATVFVTPPFSTTTISPATQDTYINTPPASAISGPAATGGNCGGNYTYLWESSTDGWATHSTVTGATALSYSPGGLTQTTAFRRKDMCGTAYSYSNASVVNVYNHLSPGSLTASVTTITYNTDPGNLVTTGAAGGICSHISYQFQKSIDGINFTDATNPTYSLSFDPGKLTAPTYFRCKYICGETTISNIVFINVNPQVFPGTIFPGSMVIPVNTSPGQLYVDAATGGACNNNFGYQWQQSSNGQANTFTDIPGAIQQSYTPNNLSATTYYRRKVTCGTDILYTNVCQVNVNNIPALYNYIQVRSITKPGIADETSAAQLSDPKDVGQSTQYFDGLGRAIQTVSRQSNPTMNDLVTFNVYDAFGREPIKYLPYAATGTDGKYKPTPFPDQKTFNSTQFPNEQFFYSRVDYESSPLNLVLATYAPGNSWTGSNRGVATKYWSNTANDAVRIWTVTEPGSMYSFGSYASSAVYPPGSLYKSVTVDENGKQVIEFKDLQGRVILKKVQLNALADDGTGSGYPGWLCNYYIYDDYNNLRCVVQPKGVDLLAANGWDMSALGEAILNEQCFRYEYDTRNRTIIKKVPGAAEVRMVYDILDRLVMTQDSVLRSQKKWQVFCYDAHNRQDTVALMTDVNHYNDHAWHISQAMSSSFYPPTATYPTEVVTQLYYDSYDWVTALGNSLSATMNTTNNNNSAYFYTTYNTSPLYAVQMQQYPIVTGMSTGSRTKIIGTSQFLYNVPFYDDHGRVIQVESSNYTNGIDYETTQYDFSGKPLRKLLVHKKNGVNPMGHVIGTKYTYDAAGRQTSIRKSMDGPEQLIDTLMYNELGQLRAKYFAGNLDSLVYDYNIRGWLTGINKKYLTGTASNYFGMELGYDGSASGITSYTTPQFNGNIAGTVWKSAGDGVSRKYDFSYDNLNRLTAAVFTQYNGSTFAASPTIDFGVPKISYDANGNILSMSQRGYKIGGSSAIDSLTYGYFTNTNRLRYVYDLANDTGSKLGDFHYSSLTKDTVNTPDYTYDGNGSLTADKNKGIRSIHYNFLNLPDTISMIKTDGSSKGNIVYKYDALGTKWAKIVTDSTVSPVRSTTTLYIQGFQYQNDTIQFVAHEEGRTRYFFQHYLAGDSSFKHRFDYFEKDHLGNTRVILTDQRDTVKYLATMDSAYRIKENALFYNIPATSYARTAASGYPVDTATNKPNDSVCRLNGSGQKVGPAIILKVMSGDKVTIGTNYYFNSSGATTGQQLSASDIVNSLASGIVSISGTAHGTFANLSGSSTPLTAPLTTFITSNNGNASGKPNAYLNWILLDNQFGYISTNNQSGALQVATAGVAAGGGLQAPLATTVNVKTSGYLYIYVSNATPNWDVFFDNLSILHYAGPLVEETHYYPFGLTMAGISDKALKSGYAENKYKFVRQLYDDDLGWDMYQFRFRDHDPQIGRFWQIDPLAVKYPHNSTYAYAEDRPINGIDLEGLEWWWSPLLGLAEDNSVITRGPVIENVVKTSTEVGNKVAEGVPENHHLMPRQLKYDPTIEAAKEAGFKFEGKENIAEGLSKFSKQSGKGQHGPHPEYTKEIARQLAEFRKDNPNATPEEAAQFVRGLVKQTKETIANNPDKKINDLFKDVKTTNASDATKNVINVPSITPKPKATMATFGPQQINM